MDMTTLESAYMGGNVGGLGLLTRSKAQRSSEREDAERLGQAAANQSGTDYDTKLRGVAEEFVTVFMNQIMKSMRATVQETPEMHGDNGEKFFQEMLDNEYAGTMAKGSGYGLTDLIYQALSSKARITETTAAAGVEVETEHAAAVEL